MVYTLYYWFIELIPLRPIIKCVSLNKCIVQFMLVIGLIKWEVLLKDWKHKLSYLIFC